VTAKRCGDPAGATGVRTAISGIELYVESTSKVTNIRHQELPLANTGFWTRRQSKTGAPAACGLPALPHPAREVLLACPKRCYAVELLRSWRHA
jgi:hypothetical protein